MKLIDADKLLRFFTVDTANQTYRFGTIKKQIENAETVQAIIIPDNATNGDMVKAMFPNVEMVRQEISSTSNNIVVRDDSFLGAINRFHADWWNAPYNNESEDN